MQRAVIAAACLMALNVFAEEVTNDTAKVVFHGRELFEVTNISSLPASHRVEILARRIREQAKSPRFSTADLVVHNDDDLKVSAIMSGADVVCWVLESDAQLHGMERARLAERWVGEIREVIDQYRRDYTADSYLKGSAFALLATLLLVFTWIALGRMCTRWMAAVDKRFAGRQTLKFLDGDSIVMVNGYLSRLVQLVLLAGLLVAYLNLVLSFFPWTFNLSARLFELISIPFIAFGRAFVHNLPNLFALLVIGFFVWLLLRVLKHAFLQIGEGKVRIRGFYPDWADPTYRLVRMLVIVFAVVIAFPYIPGSSSPAFKGVSIFAGVLFSLGSTSAVGNIVAGLVLTYMRPFMPGDFVEIGGMKGTVMARRTFATRLRTPTNEIISIPNASVSSNQIINYSRVAALSGTNIGTTVTIGYNVPWRTVHALLLKSAEGVADVLEDPAPKVLQLALDDFFVRYKLLVATRHPEHQFRILSDIHQNIQDYFAKAGVEIMSPHYQANRDGTRTAVPDGVVAPPEHEN